jgi:hypothetical protein
MHTIKVKIKLLLQLERIKRCADHFNYFIGKEICKMERWKEQKREINRTTDRNNKRDLTANTAQCSMIL